MIKFAEKRKQKKVDMAKLFQNKSTDNPKLGAKKLADGRLSIYLEFYYGTQVQFDEAKGEDKRVWIRKKEFLSLYVKENPQTPIERQEKKDTILLAEKIRQEREQQLLEDKEGYRVQSQTKVDFLQYFQDFIDNRKNKDVRVFEMALRGFKEFLKEEYPYYSASIEPKQINKQMIEAFTDYLIDNHTGSGAKTCYKRFKQVVNKGIEEKKFRINPCKGITIKGADDMLVKDILSAEELQRLFATHYERENPEIRRAFAFTCRTGARFCDVKKLTWDNVDFSNQILKFRQSKVEMESNSSGVVIPLDDNLLSIIGEKKEDAKDDLIFHLPSHTMCLKALRHWTASAEIDKHITWHSGRHSFATISLTKGANIKVVADLLGHSSLKYTQIYVRAIDEAKRQAIESLPKIEL